MGGMYRHHRPNRWALWEDLMSHRDANGWIGIILLYIPADGTVKRDSIPH